tara:strand:+ start:189 stop:485 length:297 start_codon:yes stop_codon:yes gene_type:complete
MLVYIDRDFQSIVPNYFENVRNQLDQIKSFLNRHQYKEIERLAMQLRDSGHNYGFIRVGDLGRELLYFCGLESSYMILSTLEEIEKYIESCEIKYIEL